MSTDANKAHIEFENNKWIILNPDLSYFTQQTFKSRNAATKYLNFMKKQK